MKAAVVVPTNRPERIIAFCQAWAPQFNKRHEPGTAHDEVRLLVIEDFPTQPSVLPDWVEHYCHQDIDEMGESGECIPRRSGGVRSFGFWKAAQDKTVDMIVSLDDDVTPLEGVDLLAEHWKQLETLRHLRWWPTADVRTRGYPYSMEGVKPVLNHGLWRGIPDLDAVEQMKHGELVWKPPAGNSLVPPGMYYTMCIMNVAFRPEVAPFMFMPPLPEGMKRWDDIWCGVIFKRIADLAGWAVTSGDPAVRHERASTVQGNLGQEFLGYGINEMLWKVVDESEPSSDPLTAYGYTAGRLATGFPQLERTVQAMHAWARLWHD